MNNKDGSSQYPGYQHFQDYLGAIDSGKFDDALVHLDEMISVTNIKSYAYTLKAELLIGLNRFDEALGVASLAVKQVDFNSYVSSKAFFIYAELLDQQAQSVGDLEQARDAADRAFNLYTDEADTENTQRHLEDAESFRKWINEKTITLARMANLHAVIINKINTLNLYNKIQRVEDDISKDRMRTIELLTIFTAILALIFANVQFVQNFVWWQIGLANLFLTLVLTWLLYLAYRMQIPGKGFPNPFTERSAKTGIKLLVGLSSMIVLVLVICYAIAGLIYVATLLGEWLRLITVGSN